MSGIGSNIVRIGSKIIGAGAAIMLVRDAISYGKEIGTERANAEWSTFASDVYIKHQIGDMNPEVDGLKKWYRTYILDSSIYTTYLAAKNVVCSTFERLAHLAIPIGLAAGALLTKVGKSSNPVGILCALGLMLYGAKTVVSDILGWTKPNEIE